MKIPYRTDDLPNDDRYEEEYWKDEHGRLSGYQLARPSPSNPLGMLCQLHVDGVHLEVVQIDGKSPARAGDDAEERLRAAILKIRAALFP